MKYVRLQSIGKTRDERFVFGLAPVNHDELALVWAARDYVPVSAGFLKIDPTAPHGCRTIGHSHSLNLEPMESDARMIGFLYAATLNMALPSPTTAAPTDDGALGG